MKEEFHPIIPKSMMPAAKRTFVGKAGRVITATACIGITLLGSLPVQAGEKTEKTVITQSVEGEDSLMIVEPDSICIVQIPICIQGHVPICGSHTAE